ncbi:Xaa-Pro peptidase family protein [Kaistia dalseonensis]|uniref:Xaa-Pro aminopeptidase n=1 Tax=Kaistia dalseonensis TaxID=410840 RepID=A0ABU0H408_9HYPH|nr:Xaa-Pro peptidase family protein [Kaistia dalseonensis]MCX5493649.1 Xaa-Pro peptidase family protein [Kaistia dalseonensis]MDQ0436211.1 Xaa-Pro aminopeptidase [Kaistia dalseonensis]
MTRLATLQSMLRQAGVDAVALGPGPHMAYIADVHPHADERPCLLVATPTGAAFLMPALNAEEMRRQTELPFFTWADEDGPDAALKALVESVGLKQGAKLVQVDETMRADFALLFIEMLGGPQSKFAAETVGRMRLSKDAAEKAEILRNAEIDDLAMEAAFATIKPGVTEREIAEAAKNVFKEFGATPLFTIVGAGGNGAFPHYATGDQAVAEGDAIVIDIGARSGAFSSDLTRMAYVGTPSADYLKVHAVVEAAVQAACAAAKPGVAARDVDAAARGVITAAGYGPYFTHRTGHGLGLEGHEPPYLTATSETILEEGMVFSIEPGIYLPGKFGIRLEEIVILEADGPRIVSRLPRDVFVAPIEA